MGKRPLSGKPLNKMTRARVSRLHTDDTVDTTCGAGSSTPPGGGQQGALPQFVYRRGSPGGLQAVVL